MIITGFEETEDSYIVDLLFINKANYAIRFSVYGGMLEKTVPAGTAAYATLLTGDVEDPLDLTVTNADDITASPIFDDSVTISR